MFFIVQRTALHCFGQAQRKSMHSLYLRKRTDIICFFSYKEQPYIDLRQRKAKHSLYNRQRTDIICFLSYKEQPYILCAFSFGHCVVYLLAIVLYIFWSLYCISFGHCIVYLLVIVLYIFWPLYCISFSIYS